MAELKGRELSRDEAMEILSLEKKDITLDLLRELFACFLGNDEAKYQTYDTMTVPPGRLGNSEAIKTTIGRFICNLAILPKAYLDKYGYVDKPFNKGTLEKIENQLGSMLLNDEITSKEYAEYLDYGEWIGMGTVYFLGPTMNYDINVPIPEVIERRDELFAKYQEEIKRGEAADIIEKDVIKLAREKIKEKNNESYDFFECGVGKFENNYKKTSIMAGAIENPHTKKIDILKSNYIDGIDIKEFPKFSNLTLIGGYSRGVSTQVSGYQRKKIDNVTQGVQLDEPGTDCGTKHTINMVIPEALKDMFLYRYIVVGGKEILLDEKNISQYVNKMVKLRSPMACKNEKICNKCAGELFYKMGVRNAGLYNDTMSGVLLNASMKKFHDATIKFTDIDVSSYVKER